MITIGLHGGGRMTVTDDGQVDVSQVTPKVLAFGLSHVTRFGGQAGAYCPTPESRVLTDDLRWVAAGDLKPGTGLLGFDEQPTQPGQAGNPRRRWRPSQVVSCGPIKRPRITLTLSDGTKLTAAAEHPWLTRTKTAGNTAWETAADIAAAVHRGGRFVRYLPRYLNVWDTVDTREAGWLAGIFDGEGHLSIAPAVQRGGALCGVAQNRGPVLDEIDRLLAKFHVGATCVKTGRDCQHRQLSGGWRATAEFLGTIRPMRLIEKFRKALWGNGFGKQFDGFPEPLEVVAAEDVGEGWVIGMETTTHTYLCEGFGAHNSVAEHSVRMFDWVVEEFRGLDGAPLPLLRAILLHDAPECLGEGDTQRFVKLEYGDAGIKAYAERIVGALWRQHGYGGSWYTQHALLKPFDIRLGSVEAAHFGFPFEPLPAAAYVPTMYRNAGWGYWGKESWPAAVAEDEYLDRWDRC